MTSLSQRHSLAMQYVLRSFVVRAACAMFLATSSALAASSLPGFTLVGESWTYDPGDGGSVITGRLVQPTIGTAPHPAVLVSHGQGGNAAGFVTQKANVMKTWGLVCIGPDYTHVNTGYAVGADGWSAENERRAQACLTILASLGTVDMTRVAAYGNSKGAYLTAGLCGAIPPGTLRCAAITAGGTSGTTNTVAAAPASQEVAGITTPLLLLHGSADTTVPPIQSELLANVLAANGVDYQRDLWAGVSHTLHTDRASDVYMLIRAWFSAHGVLGDPGDTAPWISTPVDVAANVGEHVGPLAFAIVDAQTAASALTVTTFSLDTALVPAANLTLSGSGADRGIEFTSAPAATTAATVYVSVDDGRLASVASFVVRIGVTTLRPFCGGDGLDALVTSVCPCGNTGAPGHGCANSANAAGAQLSLFGLPADDSIALVAHGMPASAFGLFLQHDALDDQVFHDGILCASGNLVRLRGRAAVSGVSQFPNSAFPNDATVTLSQRGGVFPGSGLRRYYATWYRNASTTFCPPATANVTPGWIVDW